MTEMPENISERIRQILVERLFLDVEPAAINETESLMDAYGVDSVRLFDMVVGLEEDFDICFEDDELVLATFDTVEAIVAKVKGKIES